MTQSRFALPDPAGETPENQSVFTFAKARFTLLTPRMIRIEISPRGRFEDRPTQQFWYRRQPLPRAEINFTAKDLSIQTDVFELAYHDSGAGFSTKAVSFKIKATGNEFHLDDPNPGQLPGTARTLDESRGSIQLEPGLISRSGWVQLDDTAGLVFNPEGWLEARPSQRGYRDLYLLVSGEDYQAALQDYQRISGRPPLLPRAFLGNWWSRYWEYTQEEIRQLVERFEQKQIPLSVFIVDMDWHITRTGNTSSGWTGFSWNRDLFPDPPGLISWLHTKKLLTSLNLHPADGIHPHEDQYPSAARRLGVNPDSKKPLAFDLARREFTGVYFDDLLHPLEADGVDFWWIDWQQGKQTSLKGLDPLWWLNHLHFFDLGRDGKKRPVIFSRWGGVGNQRYPIGFSGDTVVSWEALAYQPYFTATAANAAYGWWSHDIGGHMGGKEDEELYTRWVQFGVVSPIFRLHCSKNPFIDRAPWSFDANTLALTRQAMQLRQVLVPYLYTMAERNQAEGRPLVTPLYYEHPAEESAYLASGQYYFGSALMAAPVTEPLDPELNLSRQVVWFPAGAWYDFFSGEKFTGPQWKIFYRGLEDLPLYARAGAILPLQAETRQNGTENPAELDLVVFPGSGGTFNLYEDDGVSTDYLSRSSCRTEISSSWDSNVLTVKILPAAGDTRHIPAQRSYRLLLRGFAQPASVTVERDGQPADAALAYDPACLTIIIGPIELQAAQGLTAVVNAAEAGPVGMESEVLRLLHRARIETDTKWLINDGLVEKKLGVSYLKEKRLNLSANQRMALSETITGAGAATAGVPGGVKRIIAINPREDARVKFRARKRVSVDPQGTILPDAIQSVEVDYYGLLRKKVTKG